METREWVGVAVGAAEVAGSMDLSSGDLGRPEWALFAEWHLRVVNKAAMNQLAGRGFPSPLLHPERQT